MKRQRSSARHSLRGLLGLLASPSSYMLIVAAALTAAAKLHAFGPLDRADVRALDALAVSAADLVVYIGLATLFVAAETRWRRVAAVTIPLAAALLLFAAVNAALVGVSGEQLTREAVSLGLDRFGDVWSIATEQLGETRLVTPTIGLLLLAALPWAARSFLRRGGSHEDDDRARLFAAVLLTAVTALAFVATPRPRHPSLRRLATNAPLKILIGRSTEVEIAPGSGSLTHGPTMLPSGVDPSTPGAPTNVVVLVLESLRYDYTPLPGAEDAKAQMPNTLALARRGAWTSSARAIVPHTTKSLFAIFCGRLPAMQRALLEVAAEVNVDCLPTLLGRSGYRTAFFQSALGSFEQRPRLVRNLGFEHFEAWEEIRGEPLGYLASDDETLPGAFGRWLDASPEDDSPFLAVLLTSATHHPYRLSSRALQRLGGVDPEELTDEQRYARLIDAKDALLGEVVSALEARGLTETTVVAVMGDHGEGFGAEVVRQHDNNYFEESLRVPVILAGPGVRRGAIAHDVSLLDLAPTLLDLSGVGPAGAAAFPSARNVFLPPEPGRRFPFACWYDGYCYGYVEGGFKVVVLPNDSDAFYFDLRSDPGETTPLPLTREFDPALEDLRRVLAATRGSIESSTLGEVRGYGDWHCPPGAPCRHPDSPEGTYFGDWDEKVGGASPAMD